METKQEMIKTLREAGYPKSVIAARAEVSVPTIQQWARGGECRDPEAFARLRSFYVKVCDDLGAKHD